MTTNKILKNNFPNAVIVSDDIYPQSEAKLKNLGIKVFYSFNNKRVMKGLSKHPDMQLVCVENKKYVCAPECYNHYKDYFKKLRLELVCGNTYLSSNYPADIAYNIIVNGKYAIHNFKHTDSVVKSCLKSKELINVAQGYTHCCVCCLSDNCYITADMGVKAALEKAGCDVLTIDSGHILLPEFDVGFIGGSAFMISESHLAVNGNINYHPDAEKIKTFCEMHNINIISLSDNPIMDIGSCVPLYY